VTTADPWSAPAGTAGLIFDCDGTLAHTMPVHFEVWSETLAGHGLAMSEQRFYELAGVPTNAIIRRLADEQGVAVDDDAVPAIAHEKEQRYVTVVERVADVRRVERHLVVERAELGGEVVVRRVGVLVARVAIEADVVPEVVPLEHAVFGHHPGVAFGHVRCDDRCRYRRMAGTRSERVADVVEQGAQHVLVAAAVALGAR